MPRLPVLLLTNKQTNKKKKKRVDFLPHLHGRYTPTLPYRLHMYMCVVPRMCRTIKVPTQWRTSDWYIEAARYVTLSSCALSGSVPLTFRRSHDIEQYQQEAKDIDILLDHLLDTTRLCLCLMTGLLRFPELRGEVQQNNPQIDLETLDIKGIY